MSALDELLARGKGLVEVHAPFGSRTTYRVGGTARAFVSVATPRELDELAPSIVETQLALVALGNGSNLLVEDGERDVLVVHFDRSRATLSFEGRDEVIVEAGAGLDLPLMARRLAHQGIVGFEWAVGVPGTVGGAVAMNAGGHGDDIAGSLIDATIWRDGTLSVWSKEQLALRYRTSALGARDVVVQARFSLSRGDVTESEERVREIVRWRREHQPGGQNAGSVFRNPEGDHAARLVEEAGCKGLRLGSAAVSDKHANFIQADAGGLAIDVYSLINMVKARVFEASGVELICENHFVGFGAGS
ncbi:MAG TPA: UDP-N-acetylmuramate dehydrogenase [Acidimicrobiales bacterium]|nr:UDP-N-acetylmuramate dehydrogenase [Acidimicrobiales bacterium]